MSGEFSIAGVYVPGPLVWAVAALIVGLPLRWAMERVGAYRLVWHRGLFDLALFVLLWAAVAALGAHLTTA